MGFPETFKALADPVRREILELLKEGKLSAGEIASHLSLIHILSTPSLQCFFHHITRKEVGQVFSNICLTFIHKSDLI